MGRDRTSHRLRVALLGGGNIGQALVALLGARPELAVRLWSSRAEREEPIVVRLESYAREVYCTGTALLTPDLRAATHLADIAILVVPGHFRGELFQRLSDGGLPPVIISWEGAGYFDQLIEPYAGVTAIGFQRSPLVCNVVHQWRAVRLAGARSKVIAATVRSSDTASAHALLSSLLPFKVCMAPTYECIVLSPGNPLIHPARLFACRRHSSGRLAGERFYRDWNDESSSVLLRMHAELAHLRNRLHLPRRFIATLADRKPLLTSRALTEETRAEKTLHRVRFPSLVEGPIRFDPSHRFLREDIGESLRRMLSVASTSGVKMDQCAQVFDWHRSADETRPIEGSC